MNETTRALIEERLRECEQSLARQIGWRDGMLTDLDQLNKGIEQMQVTKRELQETLHETPHAVSL